MRRLVMAAVFAATAQGAWAADLPDWSDMPLRGGLTDGLSHGTVNWQGAYIGAQVSYSSANMNFSQATQSLTNYMLQNIDLGSVVSGWTLLGSTSPVSPGFGGFVGYNAQWDDALVGFEANYTRLSGLTGSQTNNSLPWVALPTAACFAPPSGQTVQCGGQLSGSASARLTDLVTLRGRGGYAIGNFLPYMFGGVAFGLADISRTATLNTVNTYYNATTFAQVGNPTYNTYSTTQNSNAQFAYGWTAGFGLEAMLWAGLFARGEYEYVKFSSIKNIDIQMSTVRAGLGYKF